MVAIETEASTFLQELITPQQKCYIYVMNYASLQQQTLCMCLYKYLLWRKK